MRKFRFYITDLYDGTIKGTDHEAIAEGYAQCDDFFVVDTLEGKWLAHRYEEISEGNFKSVIVKNEIEEIKHIDQEYNDGN